MVESISILTPNTYLLDIVSWGVIMAKKKLSSDRKRSRPVEKRSKLKTVKRNKLLMGAIVLVIAIVAIAAIYLVYNYVGSDTNGEDGANGNGEETYPIAVIDTSMGTIKVELYDDKAPNTCENFIKYANDGFYSGLVFHRVANLDQSALETHVVQGGGFDGDGNHKEPTYAEIDLEIDPDLTHVNGSIAMARTNDPNSATSQFFICDGKQTYHKSHATW